MFKTNLAEELLFVFTLEELLEMSNVTEEEAVESLLQQGLLIVPDVFEGREYQEEEEDEV